MRGQGSKILALALIMGCVALPWALVLWRDHSNTYRRPGEAAVFRLLHTQAELLLQAVAKDLELRQQELRSLAQAIDDGQTQFLAGQNFIQVFAFQRMKDQAQWQVQWQRTRTDSGELLVAPADDLVKTLSAELPWEQVAFDRNVLFPLNTRITAVAIKSGEAGVGSDVVVVGLTRQPVAMQALAALKVGEGVAALINQNMKIISATDLALQGASGEGIWQSANSVLAQSRQEYAQSLSWQGQRWLSQAVRVPASNMVLVVAEAVGSASQWQESLRRFATPVAIGLLCALIIGWLLVDGWSRTLVYLARNLREMSEGEILLPLGDPADRGSKEFLPWLRGIQRRWLEREKALPPRAEDK